MPLGMEVGLGPGDFVLDGDSAPPSREGKLGPHLTQCGQGRGLLHAKFHLDPSNRLAIIHQRHRQGKHDRTDTTDNGLIA